MNHSGNPIQILSQPRAGFAPVGGREPTHVEGVRLYRRGCCKCMTCGHRTAPRSYGRGLLPPKSRLHMSVEPAPGRSQGWQNMSAQDFVSGHAAQYLIGILQMERVPIGRGYVFERRRRVEGSDGSTQARVLPYVDGIRGMACTQLLQERFLI